MATEEPRMDRHDEGIDKTDRSKFSSYTGRVITAITIAVVIVASLVIFWRLLSVLLVIFAGVLLAVFLRGLTNFLSEKTPLSHGWSLFAVIFGLLALSAGTLWLLAPPVSSQVGQITQKVPEALDQLESWAKGSSFGRSIVAEVSSLDQGSLSETIGWKRISGAFSSAIGVAANVFFILAVGIYLAVDPALYKRGIVRMVPKHWRERAEEVLDVISHQLGWWLVGRLLSMLAVAVLTTIGLWLLGVPLPLVLGLLSGLLSFVPIIGPIVSFVPAGLMALLVSPVFVLYTAALYVGVQILEGYFITPIIQQRTVSLPPALILIAQLIAGVLFGLIGVLVATPVTVLVVALINLVYIEDILGDETSLSEKVPSEVRRDTSERTRSAGFPKGSEPQTTG
ncbi:AI-2E family transporter [Persicimonas caeni]|uniref:AI-2E family transporter n=1 Tax=Persicimonas caeni TaxID=2292766 RepID=A0A4Y6Q1U4_PERCE|nr:AI-2E family transporter [Persicimonas caeni]QDG54147.1 AI-2E family transporter [Persicimonas caeni]QED35368.1 AI-2E family transporter [Persicimonas caeni]